MLAWLRRRIGFANCLAPQNGVQLPVQVNQRPVNISEFDHWTSKTDGLLRIDGKALTYGRANLMYSAFVPLTAGELA